MREEGFGALYKGFLPKVLRLGPGGMASFSCDEHPRPLADHAPIGGILLVVFQGTMEFFRKMRGDRPS